MQRYCTSGIQIHTNTTQPVLVGGMLEVCWRTKKQKKVDSLNSEHVFYSIQLKTYSELNELFWFVVGASVFTKV